MSPDRDRYARIRTSHAALGSSGRIVGKPYSAGLGKGCRNLGVGEGIASDIPTFGTNNAA